MANQFAENLKNLRTKRKFSRARLARSFKGCTHNNIYSWETGKQPCYERLIEIAEFFNVTIDQLLKEEIK